MADEILNEEAAKEAALKAAREAELKREAELADQEFKLDEGLLSDIELEAVKKKFEEIKKKEFAEKEEQLKKDAEELITVETLVNEENLASLLYTSSKVELKDSQAKAAELTAFIEALLRPGIYSSVADALEEGLPIGTFIIVDDPRTDEKEFKIQVVLEPSKVEGDEAKEVVDEAKEEAAKSLSPEA
jgi:hypothetical protein